MKKPQTFLHSFKVAFNGMRLFFLNERNGRIQLIISIVVIIASVIMKLSAKEWIFILICIAMVIITEMINSAIEKVCDLISETFHPSIKVIKDISAGAVLCAAIISVVIGGIIFLPKLL